MESMRILLTLLGAALILPMTAADARPHRERGRDQDMAFQGVRDQRMLPLPAIEGAYVPRMRGARYLGPELIGEGRYRLKFMRDGQVIWIDVDARTGREIGRSGN
jgi:hypothetical protein